MSVRRSPPRKKRIISNPKKSAGVGTGGIGVGVTVIGVGVAVIGAGADGTGVGVTVGTAGKTGWHPEPFGRRCFRS